MTTHSAPSFGQSTWLVAEREIAAKLRSKAFLISFAILAIGALALVVWGGLQSRDPSLTAVAATPDAIASVEGIGGIEVTEVPDRAAGEALLLAGDAELLVVGAPEDPLGIAVVATEVPSSSLLVALGQTPSVELLDATAVHPLLASLVATAFAILFLLSAQLFGAMIAQSVVEEKQTRVVELLISAIPTRALLAGKVIGNTALAMGQILVLLGIAVVGLTVTDQTALLAGIGAPLAWFAVFFLFGFVLLASLFAAAASMVSRQEDIGSTTMPLTLLIMAPYFLVIFFFDNGPLLTALSYVPFSAPIAMPLRLFLGSAQWWEPLLSLGILAATCVAAILVGARIYEHSLLRMGARVRLVEAIRG